MTTIHNLGFPRMGARRELKFALESYWRGESSRAALQEQGARLRQRHWQEQAGLDWVPVGDFSFYDQVLDMSFTLGHLPERVQGFHGDALDNYFRVARGRSAQAEAHQGCCGAVAAGEMTKWFDTNYHYIVPEFTAATQFRLDASRLLAQLAEAGAQGVPAKPVLIGPVTYLALGKAKDGSNRLALLERLLPVYAELLDTLAAHGVQWVQIDEPILVTELDADWRHAFTTAYHQLKSCRVKLLLATYFGQLQDNAYLAAHLPVAGLHVDAVSDPDGVLPLLGLLPAHKVLSLGVVNGRNVWKTDLNATLDWLEPLAARMEVEVARDRQLFTQAYEQGKPVTKLVNAGAVQNRRGTTIRFKPDPEIFGTQDFRPARLFRLCRSKAYLFRGVEIRWSCDPSLIKDDTPSEAVLCRWKSAVAISKPPGRSVRC